MYQHYPSGLVTANEIGEFFGRQNNSRWRTQFVKGLTPYKDPCSNRPKYLIEDVILRAYDLEVYKTKGENDGTKED